MTVEPLLIVNADDFGMTAGVSEGILHAHRHGIVTSTSVLANGRALDDFVSRLIETPTLGLGAHLAVVGEDPPLLSAREIPTLVGRKGTFTHSWKEFLPRAIAGRVDLEDIRREFTAQLDRLLGLGLPISHLDAHQHLQLWPHIGDLLLTLAAQARLSAVRVPRCRRMTITGVGVSVLARRLAREADSRGIRYTADSVGIAVAGHIDVPIIAAFVDDVVTRRPTSIELTVHPGSANDPDRHRYHWGYEWERELDALTAAATAACIERAGLRLGTYRDLVLTIPDAAEVEPLVEPLPTRDSSVRRSRDRDANS